jgi:hypothetical protein
MNGKKARALRKQATNPTEYKSLKRATGAQALTNAAQAPKLATARVYIPKHPHGPTWPGTPNQRMQSRPVIVMRPIRAMVRAMLASNPPAKDGTRSLTANQLLIAQFARNQPKHRIDALALSY